MKRTLTSLPSEIAEEITKSYQIKNKARYRQRAIASKEMTGAGAGLFSTAPTVASKIDAQVKESKVIWGTDNYESLGKEYKFNKPIHDLSVIIPRVEKSKEAQKKRSKEKAEVFTPSWVCSLQNNLIDDEVVYPGAFNITDPSNQKLWIPSKEKIDFSKSSMSWIEYIADKRLEATAGEGPYLMSPYDTTTGEDIPVRDEEGRFQRIGLLDRKLRVVTENANEKSWVNFAKIALHATFGYEWQGDNLLLARLNFLNTFSDYYRDFFNSEPSEGLLLEVAEIASWNLWQMDGLKMVVPLSCSSDCQACFKKKNGGHDGEVSLIRWFTELRTFEEMLPSDRFDLSKKKN